MSHLTSATVVADSVTEHGEATRLTSIYTIFPKMVLGERNRHRAFSLSDRSSRAVPPEKLIQEVRDDPAMPAKFRFRAKGMGGGDELVGASLFRAEREWKSVAQNVANEAECLNELGLAKEIVNRSLDPFIRMHSLMTATRDGWMNFFGLRLDPGADPTIQVLAQRCWRAYVGSTPRLLRPGKWHLPFVDEGEHELMREHLVNNEYHSTSISDAEIDDAVIEFMKKLSAARCAHLSYNDLETGKLMTVERALSIYNKLVGSRPLHASPLEHQATPDEICADVNGLPWRHAKQHGNLYGWRQARKMLPGEAVAPMPEGYP